jgi:hypothetical protein
VIGVRVVARVARDGEATAEAMRAPATVANVVVFMFRGSCLVGQLRKLSRYLVAKSSFVHKKTCQARNDSGERRKLWKMGVVDPDKRVSERCNGECKNEEGRRTLETQKTGWEIGF